MGDEQQRRVACRRVAEPLVVQGGDTVLPVPVAATTRLLEPAVALSFGVQVLEYPALVRIRMDVDRGEVVDVVATSSRARD